MILELGLLSEGPEAPPVKSPPCVIEVTPGDRKGDGLLSLEPAAGVGASPLQYLRGGRAVSTGHSRVILRVMVPGHQEGKCIIDLEADGGVSDAWLWGRQIPTACGVEAH